MSAGSTTVAPWARRVAADVVQERIDHRASTAAVVDVRAFSPDADPRTIERVLVEVRRVVGERVAGLGGRRRVLGSIPVIAPRRTAASVTFRAIGPAVSWSALIGTIPARLRSPSVGLMPTSPFAPDGQTMEPSVSVPTAAVARSAAAATLSPSSSRRGSGRGRTACSSGRRSRSSRWTRHWTGSSPTRSGSPWRG